MGFLELGFGIPFLYWGFDASILYVWIPDGHQVLSAGVGIQYLLGRLQSLFLLGQLFGETGLGLGSLQVDVVYVGNIRAVHASVGDMGFAVARDLNRKKWLLSTLNCSDEVSSLQIVLILQHWPPPFSASNAGSGSVVEQPGDVPGIVYPVL